MTGVNVPHSDLHTDVTNHCHFFCQLPLFFVCLYFLCLEPLKLEIIETKLASHFVRILVTYHDGTKTPQHITTAHITHIILYI